MSGMARHNGDMIFRNEGENSFTLEDGRKTIEHGGCDWKEDPSDIIESLTAKLKSGQELVEISDGSDALFFGIVDQLT